MKKTKFAFSLVGIVVAMLTGCSQVDSDQVGFKTRFGRPDDSVLGPGLYGINPIGGEMVKYSIRDMRLDLKTQSYTKDMQEAMFVVSVIYAPERARIIELHTKYGRSYAEVILEPAIADTLKNIVGNWEAEQLVNNRTKVVSAIGEGLQNELKGLPLQLKSLKVLNIDFSDAFEKSIEEKVVQQQAALKAKNKTAQVKEEAEQKIIQAKAEAEAISIRARALNENKDIVFLNLIEKWDGKAPSTISLGAGTGCGLFVPAK